MPTKLKCAGACASLMADVDCIPVFMDTRYAEQCSFIQYLLRRSPALRRVVRVCAHKVDVPEWAIALPCDVIDDLAVIVSPHIAADPALGERICWWNWWNVLRPHIAGYKMDRNDIVNMFVYDLFLQCEGAVPAVWSRIRVSRRAIKMPPR